MEIIYCLNVMKYRYLRDKREEISRSLIFCSELQFSLSNSNSKYNTSEMLWVFIATPSKPPAIHTYEHVHTLTLLTLNLKSFNHFSNWAVQTSAPCTKAEETWEVLKLGSPHSNHCLPLPGQPPPALWLTRITLLSHASP